MSNKEKKQKRIALAHSVIAQQRELQQMGAPAEVWPIRADGMFIKKHPVCKDRVRKVFVHPNKLLIV